MKEDAGCGRREAWVDRRVERAKGTTWGREKPGRKRLHFVSDWPCTGTVIHRCEPRLDRNTGLRPSCPRQGSDWLYRRATPFATAATHRLGSAAWASRSGAGNR
eukprot:162999-Chlamydomonas_euryale.AAC.1